MGAPRTQGKRYSDDENEIIRRLFPELGALGVQVYLPHRPIQSIQKQAGRMQVFKRGTYGNKGMPVREKPDLAAVGAALVGWRGPVSVGVAPMGRAW